MSRDLRGGRESFGAAAGDLDLSARDVELWGRAGVVDSELLDAEKVLASGKAGGDGDGVIVLQVPGSLATGESGANLLDLDPVGRAISSSSAVDLGDVEGDGSLVVDSLVSCECDRRASSDGDGRSRGSASTTNVAAEVIRGKVNNRGIVVGVLADVLVLGALDTVRGEVLEDVVTVGDLSERRAEKSNCCERLHGCCRQMERV